MGKPFVGIDLRDGGVRVVTVRRSGKQWIVGTAVHVPAPEDGRAADPGELLKQALGQVRLPTRQAAVVLGMQHVLIRRLKLPRMSLRRLRQLVERERDRYIPFWSEGANFDLQILTQHKTDRQMEVLLTAVPARLLQPIQQALKAAGLQLAALESDLSGLQRAGLATGSLPSGEGVTAVIEIDASTARTGLFQDGCLVAGRSVPLAGEPAAEVAVELRRSVEVLLGQLPPETRLRGLALVGDHPEGGLAAELQSLLRSDIGSRLADQFALLALSPEGSAAPGDSAAFGAALAGVMVPRSANLLARLTWAERRDRARLNTAVALGVCAVAAYGWYWNTTVPIAYRRMETAEQTIRVSQQQLKDKPAIQKLEARRKELDLVMADLRALETPLHEVIPGLQGLVPQGVVLTDINGQIPVLAVKGLAQKPAQVTELLGRLADAPFTARVELRSVNAMAPGQSNFDIMLTLRGEKKGGSIGAAEKASP